MPSPGQYATPRNDANPSLNSYRQISLPVSGSRATTRFPDGMYITPFTTMGGGKSEIIGTYDPMAETYPSDIGALFKCSGGSFISTTFAGKVGYPGPGFPSIVHDEYSGGTVDLEGVDTIINSGPNVHRIFFPLYVSPGAH